MDYPTKIRAGDEVFAVEYVSAVKRTSSVRIKDGRVVVRLSRFTFGRGRDELVAKFLKWAEKKLARASEGRDFVNPVYEDGARLCTHNKTYEIVVIVENRKNTRVRLMDGYLIEIRVNGGLSAVEKGAIVEKVASKIVIEDQELYLKEVLNELNMLYFQERYNVCRFKRTRSRFGSCSGARNINIAYRLLFAPRAIFRYVCVHELAHLKQMNHSRRFWDLVEGAMSDYKKHEKWLRENGMMLG